MRRGIAVVLLAALLYAGFRSIGSLPPLGSLLDPANGVWAGVAATNFPAKQAALIPGMQQNVEVVFDDRGVPHIFAHTEDDAWRALGFVVARDRLFQMETQTRAAAGTLTEWMGERLLDADRESRAMGLAWGADRKLAAYDRNSSGYKAFIAYADGVNAYIDQMRPRDLPIEYRLLNARPKKWKPIHSLYFLSRMSQTLALNDATARRLRAQALVGKTAADALFPVNSPIQEPIQPNGIGVPRFDFAELPPPGAADQNLTSTIHARERLLASLGPGRAGGGSGDAVGSNSWAVGPGRAAGGHAILAGDPHLELSLPSVWYEMHIVVPGKLDVAGVGFPGVPGVVIGFNRDVAWTFTNTGSDVNDFYSETVDDTASPSRYRVDGKWRNLEKRIERYLTPNGSLLATDTLYFTHRGPMRRQLGEWLSMRWTAYEKSHEPDNFMSLGYARDALQWLDRMRDYVVPTQNGLVADRSGNIAIRSSGKYPVRPGDGRGDVIRDGSESTSDWRDVIPIHRYPFSMNPPQGFLASANQQPVDPVQNSSYMGSDWPSPWRAMRINELLRADSGVTSDEMRLFQTDAGSARADAFVALFLDAARRADSVGNSSRDVRDAARLLAEWDRRYARENRRAVLFEASMDELAELTWDELSTSPRDSKRALTLNVPGSQTMLQLARFPASVWWDNKNTSVVENRDAILISALAAGYARVRNEKGDSDSDNWRWSNTRHANIHHLLRIPAFSSLRVAVQGGPGTLNPSAGDGRHGASWRMVVELGPEVRAWAVYPGGQSGSPASPRYADRLSRWAMGQLEPVLFPRTAGEIDRKRVISTLNLSGR